VKEEVLFIVIVLLLVEEVPILNAGHVMELVRLNVLVVVGMAIISGSK
jgi:uncharacterized protein YybS (DUF2232 family)